MLNNKYRCPCCENYTFDDEIGSYDICSVCQWQDDPVQYNNPSFVGGANNISLIQARINYLKLGTIKPKAAKNC